MSCTHLGNLLTFKDLGPDSGSLQSMGIFQVNHTKIQQLFNSIFDPKTLLRIEYAFEGNDGIKYAQDHLNTTLSYEETQELSNFSNYYKTDGNRLIAICNNIIKNKGEFIL